MEFLKCRDVRWKGPKKRNKPDVVATTAKHPDSRSQISRYGWMQPTYMRRVSFWGKFTSGSRIRASRSALLKLPIIEILPVHNTRVNRLANNLRNELINMFLLWSIKFDLKPYFFPRIHHKRVTTEHCSRRHVRHMHRYACKNDFI